MAMVTVDPGLLGTIDRITLSPRAAALRKEFFNCQPGIGSERAPLTVQAWRESEGEPVDIRWAKVLKKVAEGVPTPIFRGQKLVGNETKYFRGAYSHCDYDGSYLAPLLEEEEGKVTLGGPVEKGVITEEDFTSLVEAIRFWKGKTAAERAQEVVREVMGSWYDDLAEAGTSRYEAQGAQSASCIWWPRVVNEGLCSYIKECQGRIQGWIDNREDDVDRLHFWQAVIIACEAVITLAHRYAQAAREMAAKEADPAWRAELEEIARTCEWVPENPARSFREALQSIILVHLAVKLEAPCLYLAGWGRVDRYLYPYFKRDMEAGRLTVQEAGDLVSDLLLYAARLELVRETMWRDYGQKGQLSSIRLGGTDEEGQDVSNELTYLLLHMMGLVKYAEPHLAIGWHKGAPD